MSANLLKRVALFQSLPVDEIDRLEQTLRRCEFDAGTELFQEGDPAEFFFIVVAGELEIIKSLGKPGERVVGVVETGAFIGEMGLLSSRRRRTASVRARTPVRLLEITRADFDAVLHRQPALAYQMVSVLSQRLERSQNNTIRDLKAKNLELSEAYEQLKAAQAQLVEKERMEREMEVAREIQRSMLPRELPRLPGFDFGARMEPARAVGGDFFDFIPLSKDSLGIVIGDVCDKGVPAALFMALTSSLLRSEARRASSPADAVRHVSEQLSAIKDTGTFVTLLYGVLEGRTREFRYVRAGHELPIIFDASGQEVSVAHAPGLALAAAEEILLDEQGVVLPSGGTLLLYTDGMTDVQDAGGARFGVERLRRALALHHTMPAQKLCDTLMEMTLSHRGATPQYDDVTLVALRVV
jgi:serine phosphatase RsbU (regulator of sigma subunit)